MRRWPAWLAAAALTAMSATAVPTIAATKPAKSCAGHHPYQGWTEVDLPPFPQWSTGVWTRPLSQFAIDQSTPGRVFITDGRTVLRSTDFGCTWKTVFQVSTPPIGISTNPNFIEFLAAPGGNHVYLGTNTGDGGTGLLGLYTSSDGGATFTQASGPTEPPYLDARPTSVVTTPADPKRVYLVGADPYYIQRSDDAGATWQLEQGSVELGGNSVGYLIADPTNANLVYAWSTGAGLYRSTDGAVTFKQISTSITPLNSNSVSIVHAPGAPTVVITTSNGLVGCNADCTLTGGLPTPKYGTSSAPIPLEGVMASPSGQAMTESGTNTTTTYVTKYDAAKGTWSDVTPPLGPTVLLPPQATVGKPATFWTASATNLYYRAF